MHIFYFSDLQFVILIINAEKGEFCTFVAFCKVN